MHALLLAIAASLLVLTFVVPPAGGSFLSGVPRPPSASGLTSPSVPAPAKGAGVSLSLPASMVEEGYPSAVWMTYAYFSSHWKDTLAQAAQGTLYDLSDGLAVTPSMASAGWVLGAPLSGQPPAASSASASVPKAAPLDFVLSGSGVYFVHVPKVLAGILGALSLALGLVLGSSKTSPQTPLRRGGSPR